MIKFSELVPSVYTNTSRDFQYISRLIDIVLNSVKHNVDTMYDLPNAKADPRITELLATTLGFKVKRNYDKAQLTALASVIPLVLRYKGSKEAIEIAGKALLLATGSPSTAGSFACSVVAGGTCVEVVFPKTLVDTTLFTDLLPYILPAGMTCRIIRTPYSEDTLTAIDVRYSDALYAARGADLILDIDADANTTGFATLFDTDKQIKSTTSNFVYDENGHPIELNVGLLSNSIIPSIATPLPANSDLDYIAYDNHGQQFKLNVPTTDAIVPELTPEEPEQETPVDPEPTPEPEP